MTTTRGRIHITVEGDPKSRERLLPLLDKFLTQNGFPPSQQQPRPPLRLIAGGQSDEDDS